jgi:ABC-2 type transport system ATP-binding protein
VCNRIAIIKEGEIVLVETIEELKAKFLQKMRIIFSKKEDMPTAEELLTLSNVVSAEKPNGKVRTFILTIEEDANELLKFVTKFHIKRLSIEDASIEEIFLTYY